MFRFIDVALDERAVVCEDGVPRAAIGPGRHFVWGWAVEVVRFDTTKLVLHTSHAVREVLPPSWFDEVRIGQDERGLVYRDGVPVELLRPGVHRVWTVDPTVEIGVLSLREPMPALTQELINVLPAGEYVNVVIRAEQRGLHYLQGELVAVLPPGRHAFWSPREAPVSIAVVDMRLKETVVSGQELITRDKVTLRLSLIAEHVVADPERVARTVVDPNGAVYTAVQIAARDYVTGVTLDELLEGRDAMNAFLSESVVPKAEAFGVRVERVGVKDIILPGEMKVLFNRVIEAEKEAAANVILRREETAATRSLANTAKVMADNPILLRLKELDALKEIAGQIGEVRLVVGSDGLDKLVSANLLRND